MDGSISGKKAQADVSKWRTQTRAVRGGQIRSNFDETSEALFLTSGYAYASAEEAEATFKGESNHYQYSRFGNPTVTMFENRLAALEGAEACRSTSTGMSAVFFALLALLKSGDRIVAARQLFGSCHYIVTDLLPKYGIQSELVDGGDLAQWEKALSKPTQAVLFESPSNPMLDIVDVKAVCDLAHKAGAKVVLDNAFATPILQRPLEFGADVVVHSATKYIDGQGRTLGGAVLGSKEFIIDKLQSRRSAGCPDPEDQIQVGRTCPLCEGANLHPETSSSPEPLGQNLGRRPPLGQHLRAPVICRKVSHGQSIPCQFRSIGRVENRTDIGLVGD